MSNEEFPAEQAPQKGKWSTKKKWIVGCGGCLGVVALIVVGLGILAGMGMNQLAQVSNQAVSTIFGASYKPAGIEAYGLPINNANIKTVAVLKDKAKNSLIFALETNLPEEELAILRSGKVQQMQSVLKHMTDDLVSSQKKESSSGKLRSFRLDKVYNLNLSPNKVYTVCNATLEVEKRGAVTYTPTSVALLPETNDGLIVLATFDPGNTSTSPDTNFDSLQDSMQKQILQVIKDSELDDRLTETEKSAPVAKPTHS